VEVPGQGPMLYYYLTYTVTNNTDEPVLFAPSFELSTDAGGTVVAGQGVPAAATRELLERLANPLLLDQVDMIGLLRRGEAHAREGLVVWPASNVEADEVRIYMAGFSGETARIRVIDRGSGTPRDVVPQDADGHPRPARAARGARQPPAGPHRDPLDHALRTRSGRPGPRMGVACGRPRR